MTSHRYLPKASVIEAFAKKPWKKKKKSPNVLALVGLKLYKNLGELQASEGLAKSSELGAPSGNTVF